MRIDYLTEKGSGHLNEDVFLVQDPLFAVFDGATSLDGYIDATGKTGGFLAANIAKEAFAKDDAPLNELARTANDALREAMQQQHIDLTRKESLWCTALAAVRIGKKSFEWVQITDCLLLVIHTDYSYRLLVPEYDHDVPTLLLWKQHAARRATDIRTKIKAQIIACRRDMNIGYGFLNGEKDALKFLKYGTESLTNIRHILLFTDGVLIPKQDPQQPTDFDLMIQLFREGGLRKIRDYIKNIKRADPECWQYPRLKPDDDATAIALSFD